MSTVPLPAESLPPAYRLALAYAPQKERESLLGLFALDARLAGIVRHSREPMLAQLRLAWWREQLGSAQPRAAPGDPLLAMLASWGEALPVLIGLADGWDAMIGEAPLPLSAFEQLAEARAAAFAALAEVEEEAATALRMGRNWALADLAARLSHPAEREAVCGHALAQDWSAVRLRRGLRPLAMLHALAARNLAAGRPAETLDAVSALVLIRIGLLGR